MDTTTLEQLDPIQKRIAWGETESIKARWEFGQVLIKLRRGKQLPNGLRAEVLKRFGLEGSEVTRRMQLADKFATAEEVEDVCTKHGGSWRKIIAEELIKPREDKPEQTPWGQRADWRLKKLVHEAGESDERHDELVVLLEAMLKSLRDAETVEVAA